MLHTPNSVRRAQRLYFGEAVLWTRIDRLIACLLWTVVSRPASVWLLSP